MYNICTKYEVYSFTRLKIRRVSKRYDKISLRMRGTTRPIVEEYEMTVLDYSLSIQYTTSVRFRLRLLPITTI